MTKEIRNPNSEIVDTHCFRYWCFIRHSSLDVRRRLETYATLRPHAGGEQEVAPRDHAGFDGGRLCVQGDLVVLVRHILARTVIAQAVLPIPDREERQLVGQSDKLQSELADREERLDPDVVARVAVAFERHVLEVDRIMVQVGRFPAVMNVCEIARDVPCSLMRTSASRSIRSCGSSWTS